MSRPFPPISSKTRPKNAGKNFPREGKWENNFPREGIWIFPVKFISLSIIGNEKSRRFFISDDGKRHEIIFQIDVFTPVLKPKTKFGCNLVY